MRHRLITWFFWEGFPILFQGIREVFISNMSINIHDFSWYYKNTSKFQWTVICIILKKPVTLKIKNKPLSDFNMWNYSLNNYIMVTYRVVWHQWQTPPFRCSMYMLYYYVLNVLQFSSVAQSCLTLCDPMNHSTPGLPVHHQLPEFTQTHVHRVHDAIQPSHPLSSPSPAPNPSQHQSLFQWVNSSHEVAKVLEFQL